MLLLRRLSLLFLLAFSSAVAFGQIKAVEKFVAGQDNLSKYFIYQSTLRLLNQKNDPDFNKLIMGVRKINAYVTEKNSGISTAAYKKILSDLSSEKFETLVSAKKDGTHINLMSKESGDRSYYVLAASQDDGFFALLEMDGKLDMRYLQAIEGVEYTDLAKILKPAESPAHE
jgi:hypothetical protein